MSHTPQRSNTLRSSLLFLTGIFLAITTSVFASSLGTNLSVTGNLTVTSTTATSTFSTGGLTVGTNQFVVQQTSGNVGIGTTSPASLLAVAGNGYFTGNVGVGVANPGVLLHVRPPSATHTGVIELDSGTGTLSAGYLGTDIGGSVQLAFNRNPLTGANFDSTVAGAVMGVLSSGDMVFQTSSSGATGAVTELMRIKASGNLGIGTTVPIDKLNVSGNSVDVIGVRVSNLGATGSNNYINMFQGGTSGFGVSSWINSGVVEAANSPGDFVLSAYGGNMIFHTNTTRTERMRITSAGNVGIGTTSPAQLFSVAGAGYFTGSVGIGVSSSPITGLAIQGPSGLTGLKITNIGTASGDYAILQFKHGNSSNLWQMFADSTGGLGLADISGVGTKVYVNSSGNLGIGTTTPNWLLQVVGTRPSLALSDSSAAANLKHILFTSEGGNLYIGTTTDLYATSTPASLTILNNGNVGIGTTTPAKGFAVNSDEFLSSSATTTLYIHSTGANKGGCIELTGTTGTKFRAYATTTGPLILESGTCQ